MSEVEIFEELRFYLNELRPLFTKLCGLLDGKEDRLLDRLSCKVKNVEIGVSPDIEGKALKFETSKVITPTELEGIIDAWIPLEKLRKWKRR